MHDNNWQHTWQVILISYLKHLTGNVFVFGQENCVYETVVPPLEEKDFQKTVTPIVQEYFEHGDTNEVAVSVQRNHL